MAIEWRVAETNTSKMYGICQYNQDGTWVLLEDYGFSDEKTMLAVSKRLNGDDWVKADRIYRTAQLRIWD